jgi:hypothetical protein
MYIFNIGFAKIIIEYSGYFILKGKHNIGMSVGINNYTLEKLSLDWILRSRSGFVLVSLLKSNERNKYFFLNLYFDYNFFHRRFFFEHNARHMKIIGIKYRKHIFREINKRRFGIKQQAIFFFIIFLMYFLIVKI